LAGGALISGFFYVLGIFCIIAGIASSLSGAEAGYPSLVLVLVVLGGIFCALGIILAGRR
jgi:hypothetical protein